MKSTIKEIIDIDRDAPVTLRDYSRRNPLVERSATGFIFFSYKEEHGA